MTKAELIYQAYNKVTGGQPTLENAVWIEDIENYAPSAINAVLVNTYKMALREDGDRELPSQFLGVFENVNAFYDQDRERWYITLPKRLLTMAKDRGLYFVGGMDGITSFVPMAQGDESLNIYYAKHQKKTTSFNMEGNKLWLHNPPPLFRKALIKMLVAAEDFEMDEVLPVPSGSEILIVEQLVDFFLKQRGIPRDERNDLKEIDAGGTA